MPQSVTRSDSTSINSRLKRLIKLLTTSMSPSLPENELKQLKSILQLKDDYVIVSFNLLLEQLQQEHSQIRFAAFNVLDHLFSRSKVFRDLVIANLKQIIQLTTGLESRKTLPEPVIFAKKLRAKSLSCLETWKEKYGMHYPRLRVAYRYIQGRKQGGIGQPAAPDVHQMRREHRERVRKVFIEKEIQNIHGEFDDINSSVEEAIQECNTCFELLVPKLVDFDFRNVSDDLSTETDNIINSGIINNVNSTGDDMGMDQSLEIERTPTELSEITTLDIPTSSKSDIIVDEDSIFSEEQHFHSESENSDSDEDDWEVVLPDMRQFRDYFQHLYRDFRMEIDLSKEKIQISLSPDNECIVEKLRNSLKSISVRLLPLILKWLNTIGRSEDTSLLSKVIELKTRLYDVIKRAESIEISDSDKVTPLLPTSYPKEERDENAENNSGNDETTQPFDPTSFVAQLSLSQRSNSAFNEPFQIGNDVTINNPHKDIDFSEWGKDSKVDQLPRFEGLHTFWISEPEHDKPSDAAIGMIQNRSFTYSETFKPVFHTCGVPIGVNKFCKRKDRVKCPFHGKIIPRDEQGVALDETSRNSTNFNTEVPLAQEIQDLIEDFPSLRRILNKVNAKKKKGKNIKTGNKVQFVSVGSLKNFKRRRLERILLNMEKNRIVSDGMKTEILEKNRAKFIDCFNYALKQ